MHGSLDDLKIEVDMLAPEAERIVGKNPPLDIIARDIIFGEGPVWDARNKQLFFTDIIGDTIWKWKPRRRAEAVLRPSVKANGMALDLEIPAGRRRLGRAHGVPHREGRLAHDACRRAGRARSSTARTTSS